MTADTPSQSDPTARRLLLGAVVVSLGLHAVLLPPAARWLQAERSKPEDKGSPMPTEIVLPLADWIITEPAPAELAQEPKDEKAEDEIDPRELGYARTTEAQASLTSPDRPTFVSDRNTLAQSEQPTDGDEAIPNIAGEREDTRDTDDRRYRDGIAVDESPTNQLTQATPGSESSAEQTPATEPQQEAKTQAETSTEVSKPLPEIADAIPLPDSSQKLHSKNLEGEEDTDPTDDVAEDPEEAEEVPEPNEIAVDAAPPGAPALPVTPAPSTVPVPDRDVEAFQSETRKAKLAGGAKRKGYTAFDAEDTPIGRYRKEVAEAIERSWQAKMLASQDFFGFNVKIRVEFSLNRWGKVKNLTVPKRAKNVVLTNQTLAAIIDAKLPEMPPAVFEELDGGDLPYHFNFTIY